MVGDIASKCPLIPLIARLPIPFINFMRWPGLYLTRIIPWPSPGFSHAVPPGFGRPVAEIADYFHRKSSISFRAHRTGILAYPARQFPKCWRWSLGPYKSIPLPHPRTENSRSSPLYFLKEFAALRTRFGSGVARQNLSEFFLAVVERDYPSLGELPHLHLRGPAPGQTPRKHFGPNLKSPRLRFKYLD